MTPPPGSAVAVAGAPLGVMVPLTLKARQLPFCILFAALLFAVCSFQPVLCLQSRGGTHDGAEEWGYTEVREGKSSNKNLLF